MRVHNYSGKEQGTMIVGSFDELRAMASGLLLKLDGKPTKSPTDWPPELWGRSVEGIQEQNKSDYYLSVNLETEKGYLPKTRISRRFGLPIFVLALVGVWQLLSWAVRMF